MTDETNKAPIDLGMTTTFVTRITPRKWECATFWST